MEAQSGYLEEEGVEKIGGVLISIILCNVKHRHALNWLVVERRVPHVAARHNRLFGAQAGQIGCAPVGQSRNGDQCAERAQRSGVRDAHGHSASAVALPTAPMRRVRLLCGPSA